MLAVDLALCVLRGFAPEVPALVKRRCGTAVPEFDTVLDQYCVADFAEASYIVRQVSLLQVKLAGLG